MDSISIVCLEQRDRVNWVGAGRLRGVEDVGVHEIPIEFIP